MVAMLLAAFLAGADPAAGSPPSPAGASVKVVAEVAWETSLSSRPVAPPRVLSLGADKSVVLLPLEQSVEARAVADGALLWSRADLAGAGLATSSAAPAAPGVVAWAGALPDGAAIVVIDPASGRDISRAALPAPAIGPPTAVVAEDGRLLEWAVPLDGGQVALVSPAGKADVAAVGRAIAPPLFGAAGKAIAILDSGDAVTVGAPSRRPAARGVKPGTVLSTDRGFYAGGTRDVSAWRCKIRRRGVVSCTAQWRQALGGAVTAAPIMAGDRLLVGAWDTFVYSFDHRKGHLHWRTRAGLRLATPLLLWDDWVAAAAEGVPQVQFFRLDDGALVGKIEGKNDEIFIAGIARAGDLLLAPTLPYPALRPSLRAYRVRIGPVQPKP